MFYSDKQTGMDNEDYCKWTKQGLMSPWDYEKHIHLKDPFSEQVFGLFFSSWSTLDIRQNEEG